jgi:hypothetical protein
MRIAVAGGTGWAGRRVVEAVSAAGHEPVVIARSAGQDLTTGAGLNQALRGAHAVIDVSNVVTTSRERAVTFFAAETGHLLAAGQRAGVAHHVLLSVVGVDPVDLGYYVGKLRRMAGLSRRACALTSGRTRAQRRRPHRQSAAAAAQSRHEYRVTTSPGRPRSRR